MKSACSAVRLAVVLVLLVWPAVELGAAAAEKSRVIGCAAERVRERLGRGLMTRSTGDGKYTFHGACWNRIRRA